MLDYLLLRLGGLFFMPNKRTGDTPAEQRVFLIRRECPLLKMRIVGGFEDESENSYGLYGLQAEELQFHEEQEE
jgi:hypothetical protein